MNESQLRAANNDGMDPYWKPDPPEPVKIETIDRITKLFNLVEDLIQAYKNESDEELAKDGMTMAVRMNTKKWLELRDAIKAVKGKELNK